MELVQQPTVLPPHKLLERWLERPLRRALAFGPLRGQHCGGLDHYRGLLVRRVLRLRVLQLLRRQRLRRRGVRLLHLLERVPGAIQ